MIPALYHHLDLAAFFVAVLIVHAPDSGLLPGREGSVRPRDCRQLISYVNNVVKGLLVYKPSLPYTMWSDCTLSLIFLRARRNPHGVMAMAIKRAGKKMPAIEEPKVKPVRLDLTVDRKQELSRFRGQN